MNVITCKNKFINIHNNNKLIRINRKNTQQRLKIVCNVNKNNKQNNNIITSEKQISHSSSYIDNGLLVFSTVVFSSVMVLSTCIVMILCARETNMEANGLQEKYTKLYEEVKHLEAKNMDDEMMINAIVGEVVKLKSIGII
jgi:hypothetical protein